MDEHENDRLWKLVSNCRRCNGHGYQSAPVFYCGNVDAEIMVIAQNPGEIKSADTERLLWAATSKLHRDDVTFMKAYYLWDFSTSYGARKLGEIFGQNWLDSGRFLYTNAVRCRTEDNEEPSYGMISKCLLHTSSLLMDKPKRPMITIGRLALSTLVGSSASKGIRTSSFFNDHNLGWILALPHYSVWKSLEPVKSAYELFLQAIT